MKKNKEINKILGVVLYILQVLASGFFLWAITGSQLLPATYKIIIEVVVVLLAAFSTFILMKNLKGKLSNVLRYLAVFQVVACLALAGFAFPTIEESLNKLDLTQPETGDLYIDVISLKETTFNSVKDFTTEEIGVQTTVDQDNQKYALDFMKSESLGDIKIKEYKSFDLLLKALEDKEIKYALINETYLAIYSDMDGFEFLSDKTKVDYQVKRIVAFDAVESDVLVTEKPFNILIIGQNESRTKVSDNHNTDVVLLATVNPKTKQILLTSFPRDSYVPVSYSSVKDKLTHAGIYGSKMTVKTIANFMDLKIDFYIRINYHSLTNLVNTVGGVTVNNPYAFKGVYPTYRYNFAKGPIELDGNKALAYVRERKKLPNGDMGRNEHQRIVLEALVKKITTPSVLVKFNQILQAVQGTYLTNFSTQQIYSIAKMQLADLAHWNILEAGISGSTGSANVASLSQARKYSVVFPYDSHVNKAKNNIKRVMNGDILTPADVKMPK